MMTKFLVPRARWVLAVGLLFGGCSKGVDVVAPTEVKMPTVEAVNAVLLSTDGAVAKINSIGPPPGSAVKWGDRYVVVATFSATPTLDNQHGVFVEMGFSMDGKTIQSGAEIHSASLGYNGPWTVQVGNDGSTGTITAVCPYIVVKMSYDGQFCEPQGSPNCAGIRNYPAWEQIVAYPTGYTARQ